MASTTVIHGFKRAKQILTWSVVSVLALSLAIAAYSWYLVVSFDTKTLPERYGQVDAKLYLPHNQNRAHPRPLLVLLGGAEGGNSWARGYWNRQRERFIDQGYALLALGYFGLPNTPEKLDRIALEGVHAAIRKATQDQGVNPHCIAVIGGSRGAELALLLASHYPDIGAVVAMAPASAVFVAHTDAMTTSAFALDGKALPFVPMLWSATPQLLVGDIGGVMRKLVTNTSAMTQAAIAVERINGPILLISGAKDEMWPAREMSVAMMDRLEQHSFPHFKAHWDLPGRHDAAIQEFPRIESFLNTHFAPLRESGKCR